MKKFEVTDDICIQALGAAESQKPLIHIVFDDFPDCQIIPIFADEIRALIAALTEAAVWLADGVGNDEQT